MKSICIFNNKGGVGKTTLLCNLASYLAQECKKKVLIIDCDPQCNATAYMLQEPQLEKIYVRNKAGTIDNVIKPIRRGKGFAAGTLPIIRSPGFKLDLIPGDPRFSLAEDFLSKDWVDVAGGSERGLRTTTFITEVLAECSNYDYVFFDVGPSLGAINRTVLLACDLFLIPVSSDIFSLRGLQNIELAVQSWKDDLSRGLQAFHRKERTAFIVNDSEITVSLQFVGYVTQQYTAKTVEGKKQPVKAYERIIRQIPQTIQTHIINVFNKAQKSVDYSLGEIPNLQSVVPMSQIACKPIFSLGSADGIVGSHFYKIREFKTVVAGITKNLEKNIARLS
jgi:cellulose biosynthesis protein BcsQ